MAMETPIYKCWCKATNAETGELRYSQNWLVARRAWFRVYDDRVECGDWRIPFESVTSTTLFRVRLMIGTAKGLRIETGTETYLFGFNPWASPEKHLDLELKEESTRLKYSPFSLALRIVTVGLLIYWLASKL